MVVSTFGQWLDQVAEHPEKAPDLPELVRGVARLWRDAKGERPRASAPETIGNWLAEHRDVHPDAMAAAAAEYRTMRLSSSGRQLTIEEAERFHAGNAPSDAPARTITSVDLSSGDLAAALPAIMAVLGRIEAGQSEIRQRLSELTQGQLALLSAFDAPPSDGEQAAEAAYEAAQEPIALDGRSMVDPPNPDAQAVIPPGSLWQSIMVPPPDFARMARDGSGGAEQAE